MRILLLCFLFFSQCSSANFDWTEYSELLKEYVQNEQKMGIQSNLVDYKGIGKDPRYLNLLEQLASFNSSNLLGNEKLAFYINTYNIFTIKLIIDYKPTGSIKDIGSWFNPVWQKPAGVLSGNVISLDTIEHKILRPMNEPRIHFAITCASMSCPDIRKEPYESNKLESQLEEQTLSFINNEEKGIKLDGENIYISKIFDWFSEDFSSNNQDIDILRFIAQYKMEAGRFSHYKTLDYNWKLNQQ
jgi:hypothetical protein